MDGNVWLCRAMDDCVGLCYGRLCSAVYGSARLCRAIYSSIPYDIPIYGLLKPLYDGYITYLRVFEGFPLT